MLAVALGACAALVIGGFVLGRGFDALAERLRRLRPPRPG